MRFATRRTLRTASLLLGFFLPPHLKPQTVEQESSRPVESVRALSAAKKRMVAEPGLFSPGAAIPQFENGYFVRFVPETALPDRANVMLWDESGKKIREALVWFPDAETVSIVSAAVGRDGSILASGTAVKADGTRAYYVEAIGSSGKVTDVVQTNPFFPARVCEGSDGSVWSFGQFERGPDGKQENGNILRHFDLKKGLLGSFLPDSTLPVESSGHEMFLRCLSNRLFIYVGGANEYIEFDTTNRSAKRFKLDRSANELPIHGFAITEKGDAYGFLQDFSSPTALQGLFYLQTDKRTGSARWVPVAGGTGRKGESGVISGLWGAQGDYIVHGYGDDAAGRLGVSWSLLTAQSRVAER